ncbi:hypothetical protein RRG08_032174 [Elysia crispata]|uniref:Uncharacterized protein n=1 Tax=Elysia crispata TaxID=231223 RepID=A0AAE1ACV3_9GAST|nr:hypothetical protein RRG08_032174 [Elysia crispata]
MVGVGVGGQEMEGCFDMQAAGLDWRGLPSAPDDLRQTADLNRLEAVRLVFSAARAEQEGSPADNNQEAFPVIPAWPRQTAPGNRIVLYLFHSS